MRKKLDINNLIINGGYDDRGFVISVGDIEYKIHYEDNSFVNVPISLKELLVDQITMATTIHLPTLYNVNSIKYLTGKPILENHFMVNFLKDIPSCTDIDGSSADDLTRDFLNLDIIFGNVPIKIPANTYFNGKNSVVAMSFGKDSLLSYALAQEIGLNPEIAYVIEQSLTYEEKHKRELSVEFSKEFGSKLHVISHETGKLRDYDYLGLQKSEIGWGLQNTEYTLLLLPLAYANRGKYIIFGNEQSTDISYYDRELKWKVIPAFDQTHEWTTHLDSVAKILSSGSVGVTSLIEPLMDMMIQRMLITRYPKIAKYQMSCFTEEESGSDYRWCHRCSVCAKMYLLCAGSGLDPKIIGFRQSMLSKENQHLFTLFGGHSEFPYANTSLAKDEQLFAFYCAAKKGVSDSLVEKFKLMELYQEAIDREEELFKKYCSIYPSMSIPPELLTRLLPIYQEELATFEI